VTTTTYLISPDSLSGWFDHFADLDRDDLILHLGEGETLDARQVSRAIGSGRAAWPVVIYSSHSSLARDQLMADGLRLLGYAVQSQSASGVALASDKLLMKEFLDRNGFATARWAGPGELGTKGLGKSGNGHLVVKDRHGTQSIGTRLAREGQCFLAPDEFCERYHPGTEYSVVVYRDQHRLACFPAVWKGHTSLNLIPPWRRLRLCPYPQSPPGLDDELREMSVAIACAADLCGYTEIEFLVTENGEILVLELNPRVCGTLRLVAMATGVPVFAIHHLPDLDGTISPRQFAAEIPYGGPQFCLPCEQAYATSRLTVACDDPSELGSKLLRFSSRASPDDGWRTQLPPQASRVPAGQP
jgi:ATP-grasp domain